MPRQVISTVSLVTVSFAVGFAVFHSGGGDPASWSLSLLIVGLAALVLTPFLTPESSSPLETAALGAALLFPAYVVLQLIPLPLSLLRTLDPTRAEIANALGSIIPAPSFASVTISSDRTWVHLSRIASYMLVFFVAREATRRAGKRLWWSAAPLLVLGGLEALLGLAQGSGSTAVPSGTYVNHNHFSGLLEMTLPFALMLGAAVLYHGRPVSADMAFRVARAAGVPIDDVLGGKFPPPGTCPHCGHASGRT